MRRANKNGTDVTINSEKIFTTEMQSFNGDGKNAEQETTSVKTMSLNPNQVVFSDLIRLPSRFFTYPKSVFV